MDSANAQPSISVIIPTYNHADALVGCLQSIFNQTVPVKEIIVIDDGSRDGTHHVLIPFLSRIQYVYQENAGAPAARNHGFRISHGDLVIFCDADVIMQPNMLQKMTTTLTAHPEASFSYSGFQFGWKRFKGLPYTTARLHETNFIHTTSLVRRTAFPSFDEQIKRLQDWDLWLTMSEQGNVGVCASEAPLFHVRIDGASRIGSSWLPKFFYRFPWQKIGWAPKNMQRYLDARNVLTKKHPKMRAL